MSFLMIKNNNESSIPPKKKKGGEFKIDPIFQNLAILIAGGAIGVFGGLYANKIKKTKEAEQAKDEATIIIEEGKKAAEAIKREKLIEAKDEIFKERSKLEKERDERRNEIQRSERRLQQKEENLERKLDSIEKREKGLVSKEQEITKRKEQVASLENKRLEELERIAQMSLDEAKDVILKKAESELKQELAIRVKNMEEQLKETADLKSRRIISSAIQKWASEQVVESTVSVVPLPNDEMKGRIIGREGRNIRMLESLTGVDLIIDDTPEAVVLSCFDPIRREIARLALEKLIIDARIHPARIEEMVEKAKKEM